MPRPAARPRPARTAVLALLAAVAVLTGVVLSPPTASADQHAEPAVVLVGTAGLRWDDVTMLSTPALWELSRDASIGTVAARSVRSSACPADGWLAVSAGARAADLPGEGYGECRRLVNPLSGGAVPGWAAFQESADASSFDPTLGLLGSTLQEAGVPTTGFGAGAAIALSDTEGLVVGEHLPVPTEPESLQEAVGEALEESQLVVVDAGSVRDTGRATVPRPDSRVDLPEDAGPVEEPVAEPEPTGEEPAGAEVIVEPTRPQQVQPIDARVGAVLAAAAEADRDVTVLVVSLADSGTRARMQLAAALGPAPAQTYGESLLGSRSTRQDGIIQATDVTPTLLSLLGADDEVPSGALVGAPVRPVPGPETANARLRTVLDIDQHSAAVRPITPRFFTALIVINLLLYAAVSAGFNGRVLAAVNRYAARPSARRRRAVQGMTAHPARALRGLRVAGVVVGSLPVAGFLANAFPWWRAASPSWALVGLVAAWIAVLSALALLPRWRDPVLGPAALVAWSTALVLAVDVATGATLQVSAPMGVQPVVAGRFYGFNNTAFALFAASTLLGAAALADPLVRAGRRRAAAGVVAAIGVAATVLNGTPGLGSDFGGPPALVPGFAVLTILAAGLRLSWGRLVAVLGVAALVVVGFSVMDWLRPVEDRTHLGRFVDTVLDGGLWSVVGRKLAQNAANLGGTWLTLLAIGGIAVVALVLIRPLRWAAGAPDGGAYGWLSSGRPLGSLVTDVPMLRPALVALAVTLGIGFLVNDSGIVIPAIGVSVAVPLLVSVCAGWLLHLRGRFGAAPRLRAGARVR